jgi:hypothetical protein
VSSTLVAFQQLYHQLRSLHFIQVSKGEALWSRNDHPHPTVAIFSQRFPIQIAAWNSLEKI